MDNIGQPIQTNQRIVIIDVLRGWAILGVVIMNYFDFFTFERDWQNFKPDPLISKLIFAVSFLLASKSWTLLSLLFGYGFSVVMEKFREKGKPPCAFFAKRMFWLFAFALINSALFVGDILKDYAFLGVLMLLFYRASAKTTFTISLVLLIGLPFLEAYINSLNASGWALMPKLYPLYKSNNLTDVLWFGIKGTYVAQIVSKPYLYTVHWLMFICMLWGATLHKINFFGDVKSNAKYVQEVFWLSLIATITVTLLSNLAQQNKWAMLSYFSFKYLIVICIMLLISSAICWLYVADQAKSFFRNIAYIGRMTLTNYLTQNLIGLIIFSGVGFGVWNTKPLWFYILLAITVYTLQMYFSKWWLSKYNYGPLEWIWRQLSYGKRLRLKKVKI